ncbi:MAG: hypothetical protein RLN96_01710 [Pseudomonadales bacterium]
MPDRSSDGKHIEASEATSSSEEIPEILDQPGVPIEPEEEAEPPALYSITAQDLPARELLFTVARDAGINIDVHPEVRGNVSINAVNQTLPQILDRISRQADIRWSIDYNGNLLIERDRPYWDTYRVDYVNVDRESTSNSGIANTLGSGGTGGSSSSSISQTSSNNFWQSLQENLVTLVFERPETADGSAAPAQQAAGNTQGVNQDVIVNAESGVIAVRASAEKHAEVRSFINYVKTRALQQVMIEATVVEVALSDQYQAGVDWETIAGQSDNFVFQQSNLGGNLTASPTNILTYQGSSNIAGTVRALSQFGNSQVLSSPKVMALNNQSAMLRVVDNRVYFTIEVEPAPLNANGIPTGQATYESTINTVPVGFSMVVTPQVGENDQVTLNVRPTISRIAGFVNDPNPVLAQEGIVNQIPEIQIQEVESVLKVFSGQTAVLGGLMQDSLQTQTDGLPAISRVPILGNLFSYRDDSATKTELVIFIRPVVVRQPSIEADLSDYKKFLPTDQGSSLNNSTQFKSDFWNP